MKIVIIDYGAGNMASVKNALERLNIQVVLSNSAEEIASADKVIFPGVGEARHAMTNINEYNLANTIKDLTQPVLGICLGMQLMCNSSEERDTKGLGIFPVDVKKFVKPKKVPHIGWNTVQFKQDSNFSSYSNEYFYFVHSYYVPVNDFTTGVCNYENDFSASMKKDNFWGCQFHPEKSADIGQELIKTFIEKT